MVMTDEGWVLGGAGAGGGEGIGERKDEERRSAGVDRVAESSVGSMPSVCVCGGGGGRGGTCTSREQEVVIAAVRPGSDGQAAMQVGTVAKHVGTWARYMHRFATQLRFPYLEQQDCRAGEEANELTAAPLTFPPAHVTPLAVLSCASALAQGCP